MSMHQNAAMYRSPYGESGIFGAAGTGTGNKGAFARFSRVAVENEALSKEAGSAIFQEEIHVEVLMPGDPLNIPKRRVKLADGQIVGQEWIEQFPREWSLFERNEEQMPDGMPLKEWPECTKALQATLQAIHIHTVEMLAGANEAALDKIGMGARTLQAKARAFLETVQNTSAATKFAAEKQEAVEAMESMAKKMAEMQRQLDLLSRSGKILAGAAAEAVPAPASVSTDPLVAAAIASGAKPLGDIPAEFTRRGPGRPPKHQG